MVYKEKFKMQLKDIGKDNYIKNRAILEIFENIEEIIKREEEYDEKYNDGKKSHKEVTKLTLGD